MYEKCMWAAVVLVVQKLHRNAAASGIVDLTESLLGGNGFSCGQSMPTLQYILANRRIDNLWIEGNTNFFQLHVRCSSAVPAAPKHNRSFEGQCRSLQNRECESRTGLGYYTPVFGSACGGAPHPTPIQPDSPTRRSQHGNVSTSNARY